MRAWLTPFLLVFRFQKRKGSFVDVVFKAYRQEFFKASSVAHKIQISQHRFETACASILAHLGVLCACLHFAVTRAAENVLFVFIEKREQFFRFGGLRDGFDHLDDFVVQRTRLLR